jgi:hypothetical protein
MKTSYYKFCYWLGYKLGIRRMEVWAYLHWFSISATDNIFAFFKFSDDYFKFCERWGIKANTCSEGK